MDIPSSSGTSTDQQNNGPGVFSNVHNAAGNPVTTNPVISTPMDEWLSDDDVFQHTPHKLSKKVCRPNSKDIAFNCKFCHASYSRKSHCKRHESSCRLNADKGSPKFPCPRCKKQFRRSDLLKRHLKKCNSNGHSKKVSLNCKFCNIPFTTVCNRNHHEKKCKVNDDRCPPIYQCVHCNSKFHKKFHLCRHLKRCSLDKPRKPLSKTPCLIKNCSDSFFHKSDLIDHLISSHQTVVTIKPKVSMTFPSIEKFHVWKEQEEESTHSYFSARKGQKSSATKYFYCQHDGSGRIHSKSKQRLTSKRRHIPPIKVGHHCIAKIKMTENDDKTIQVEYYPTHSHFCKPEDQLHHPIPAAMSKFIDEKLAEKIPPAVVYDLVKEHFLPKNNSEVHNTRADNLTRHLVLERGRRRSMKLRMDKDDAKSVYLLAAQRIQEDNSILIYKPVGQNVVHGPQEINNLPDSEDLFMFGFQTESQLTLMKRHCSKILIVDETHGTNQYDYRLLTVMVVDENRRGWPVAHLISSKSDADTLQFFFQTLRERLDCKPSIINTVITDDDPALINAMKTGFSQTLTHLLCKWHVIKNLKENLRKKGPRDLFDEMFSEIKVIVNAEDESLFLKLKNGFKNKYDKNPDAKEYMDYLNDYYWKRAEKWAMCYRRFPHANVDTTGHVESFHNRFKTNCMKRKPFKRLDDLINLLYDIAWNDECIRCREAKVGFSVQPQKIAERHQKGLALDDDVIIKETLGSGLWEVKSGSGNGTYFITRHVEHCDFENCYSKCTKPECHSLCSHLFSCSCPDSHPLCKHIHKLQSVLFRNVPHSQITEEFYNIEGAQTSEIREELYNDDNQTEGETSTVHDGRKKIYWEKLKGHLASLQEFIAEGPDNVSEHRIIQMEATLSSLIPCLKPEESKTVVPPMKSAKKFAPNEKLKTQLSQIAAFKRPPAKRRRKEDASSLAAKKQQAIESLSKHAKDDAIDAGEDYFTDTIEDESTDTAEDESTDTAKDDSIDASS